MSTSCIDILDPHIGWDHPTGDQASAAGRGGRAAAAHARAAPEEGRSDRGHSGVGLKDTADGWRLAIAVDFPQNFREFCVDSFIQVQCV